MKTVKRKLRKLWLWIRFGKITEHVTLSMTAWGAPLDCEIEYRGRFGRVVGFWAYGYWNPDYPYKGK